jgi:hypothetical protein
MYVYICGNFDVTICGCSCESYASYCMLHVARSARAPTAACRHASLLSLIDCRARCCKMTSFVIRLSRNVILAVTNWQFGIQRCTYEHSNGSANDALLLQVVRIYVVLIQLKDVGDNFSFIVNCFTDRNKREFYCSSFMPHYWCNISF